MGARAPGATCTRRLGADGGRELSEDGGPEAVEVSGARRDDKLDGVVEEGEGGEDLAKARRHLVESPPRGEVGHVGLGGHVVEPDVGPKGQVGGVECADDGEGVGDRGIALGHPVEGAGVVDVVDDVLLVEGGAGKGDVHGSGREKLELADEGVLAVKEGELGEADVASGEDEPPVGAREGVARRKPDHEAEAANGRLVGAAIFPHGIGPDDDRAAEGGARHGREVDDARLQPGEDHREEGDGG